METIETIEHQGYTIRIVRDSDPQNPRAEFDHLGTMVCFHRRYLLGDFGKGCKDQPPFRSEDFNGWADMENHIRTVLKAVVVKPIYLYDHSGLSISTKPFSFPWDSGQVGFIYVTREKALSEYNTKRITQRLKEQIDGVLEAEVSDYHAYISGDVFGYVVEDSDGNHIDSCFGYYGYKTDNYHYMIDQAKEAVDHTRGCQVGAGI